jgi:hypothetical protein
VWYSLFACPLVPAVDDLSYQYYGTPERSQLSSIEECVNDKCLPKTEFEWEESDESIWYFISISANDRLWQYKTTT